MDRPPERPPSTTREHQTPPGRLGGLQECTRLAREIRDDIRRLTVQVRNAAPPPPPTPEDSP